MASQQIDISNTATEASLDGQASHDRTKSAPGGATFSHAKEFEDGAAPPGIQDTSAPEDSVEVLTAGTSAYNQGNAGFIASLNEAKEKQEEAGTTAV